MVLRGGGGPGSNDSESKLHFKFIICTYLFSIINGYINHVLIKVIHIFSLKKKMVIPICFRYIYIYIY